MNKKGLIYIILASVLWGTSGIFVHYLAPYGLTSLQMTFIRGFVSFICMMFYILVADRKLIKTNINELVLFLGSGISFFLTATCYYHSMQLTSISTAVVLMYTAPIFVMIYSVMFLGEKLSKLKFLSVAGMIIGCGFVSGIIGGLKFNTLGIAIGFVSGISYASYNIITKIEMQKGINPFKANFYCFLFSMLVGILIANPYGIIDCISINPPVVIPLSIGVGVIACIMPYFFYTLALEEIPAGTASSLGILEPMAATIFSVIIFKEQLSTFSVIGIILILGSVFLLSRENE
jgi:drug/metabolite transporter (DMT)-like permease